MNVRVGILTAPHIEYEQRETTFVLKNVRIGIGFHWDREEEEEFAGQPEIRKNADGTETAVNTIDIEDYLCSVISSEMNADSPMELLKAHAVISRSWVIRAIEANRHRLRTAREPLQYESNGHIGFDVCADDHCQRYEGIRRINRRATEAVQATRGQVLVWKNENGTEEICDCRFHKCCGGKTERFSTCWEDKEVPYLQPVDCPYCNTKDEHILRQVLNGYDQETSDFHDWEVRYSNSTLREILLRKSGIDYGEIKNLVPLRRGASGRIYQLRIEGSLHTETIGKELVIRRRLSDSCLYSSWFDIEKESDGAFVLRGHGWGHGVGLCQIGAAVMADQGKSYDEILRYYYPGSILQSQKEKK